MAKVLTLSLKLSENNKILTINACIFLRAFFLVNKEKIGQPGNSSTMKKGFFSLFSFCFAFSMKSYLISYIRKAQVF
jgi:hypothetical protein